MPTFTVRQAGGDFSTLASALADAGTAPNDIISIEGLWTVDDDDGATVSDDGITIQTDNDSYHGGVYDEANNHYRLEVSSGVNCLTVNNTGCIVDGLAINQASLGASAECIRMGADEGILDVNNCILTASNNVSDQDGLFSSVEVTVNVENCIIYGFARAGIHNQQSSGGLGSTYNINSTTIWDCSKDAAENDGGGIGVFRTNRTHNMNLYNCCIVECNSANSDDYNEDGVLGTVNWNIHNSIDSDGSITDRDAAAVGAIQNLTATDNTSPGVGDFVIFRDITTAVIDLRLVNNTTDNDAQDAHSATSGAGMTLPILDIEKDIRERGTNEIDIGADSIPSALPPVEPGLPEYGQGRAAIGDPPVYGATIVRS